MKNLDKQIQEAQAKLDALVIKKKKGYGQIELERAARLLKLDFMPDGSLGDNTYSKKISEHLCYWFYFNDCEYAWGIGDTNEDCNVFEEGFETFDDCLQHYLQNKDFWQVREIRVSCSQVLMIDTRQSPEYYINEVLGNAAIMKNGNKYSAEFV